ncbi:MAG: D-alanyl-D-alanine carboxypeptidase/D-alanyl-D-alanine-endopeptidase [Actinobacteria bacterium]|nr:D-alanyl-D-alanine carboxypeptidase/D-alanyl-D-alanine-endopeptidase [Actinomycetota bacterium]
MRRHRLIGLLLALGLACSALLAPPVAAAPLATPQAPTASPVSLDSNLLASKLAKPSQKKLTTAWAVYTADGKPIVARDRLMVPASTTKILTALAAIDVLGADRTFTTKVVSAKRGKLTLVGGGDPYLTSGRSTVPAKKANLTDLVAATAKALKAAGVKKVTLTYSAPRFSGPRYSSSWKKTWASYTPRIMSLTVNGGKSGGAAYQNPAKSTAKLFAKKLRAKGFTVSLTGAASAPKGAKVVAAVESARLGTMVRRMLRYSDNVAAEMLARHVATATDRAGSFAGGSAAVTAWLKGKELWGKGMKIDGGSGLSSKTKVLPSVLARSVGFALSSPKYVDVVKGLPVAGVDGTLKNRFDDPSEKGGRKAVHAKTGSLKKVNALAGYVTTKDGQVLTFAFLASHNGTRSTAAGNWLDRSASILARCGCSLATSG